MEKSGRKNLRKPLLCNARVVLRFVSQGKIFIFQCLLNIMTLDDFFRECEKEGAVPLSYRSHAKTTRGSRTVEYENPRYPRARGILNRMLNRGGNNGGPDNLVSGLYGEEVIIRTRDGYHLGKLYDYDGKSFMLGNYLFSRRPMDIFEYSRESFLKKDRMVPAENIISISKIPILPKEFA